MAELNRAGIPCGVLIAPLMPGINDDPEQVEEILALATENGATHVGGIALHLRGEVRQVFFDWLREHRPDLIPRYGALYRRGAYVPAEERKRLGRVLGRARRKAGHVPAGEGRFSSVTGAGAAARSAGAAPAALGAKEVQAKLF